MSTVLMALGPFRFGVAASAFDKISRRSSADWASQRLLNRPVAYQYTGPGEESLSISGTLFRHWTGGLEQLAGMRAAQKSGRVMILASADGNVMGPWFIKQVSDNRTYYDRSGRPRKVGFHVRLIGEGSGGFGLGSLF